MRTFQLFLTTAGLHLLCQASAGFYGGCAYDCIRNLNIAQCDGNNFFYGWDCICANGPTLSRINSCVASSCSSSDQNSIFAGMAQACANRGTPITVAPAQATFSATSGGTLFASVFGTAYSSWLSNGPFGDGRGRGQAFPHQCSWTTFTGTWNGGSWLVNWSGFSNDGYCSTTGPLFPTATLPSIATATTTGNSILSVGATVVTTVNGQALTGTIFSTQAPVVSTANGVGTLGGTGTSAAQNGGLGRNDKFSALAAMVVALLAATYML